MLISVEQGFVGREEIWASLKMPAGMVPLKGTIPGIFNEWGGGDLKISDGGMSF